MSAAVACRTLGGATKAPTPDGPAATRGPFTCGETLRAFVSIGNLQQGGLPPALHAFHGRAELRERERQGLGDGPRSAGCAGARGRNEVIRHPIESNFYIDVSETAVEVIFAPTRSRYTYNRLVDHKETFNLRSPNPLVRHAGSTGDTGDYPPEEVQAMTYRVALAALRRLRRSAKPPAAKQRDAAGSANGHAADRLASPGSGLLAGKRASLTIRSPALLIRDASEPTHRLSVGRSGFWCHPAIRLVVLCRCGNRTELFILSGTLPSKRPDSVCRLTSQRGNASNGHH
jgi:hypothetical protein